MVDNLTQTLTTVDSRHEQLSDLVVSLKDWMADLAADRELIGSSLGNISDLTVVVADLLRQGRPLLKSDIAKLRRLAALLNQKKNSANLVELLDRLPGVDDRPDPHRHVRLVLQLLRLRRLSGRITLPLGLSDVPGHQAARRASSTGSSSTRPPRAATERPPNEAPTATPGSCAWARSPSW